MTRITGYLGILLVLVAGLSHGTLSLSLRPASTNASAEWVDSSGHENASPLEVITEGNRYFVKIDLDHEAV